MQKLSILGVIAIFLFSSNAFADSFGISWGSDQNAKQRPTAVQAGKNGPPAHAPAHGYRSKRRYQYYPSSSAYHDASRGLYFYLSGSNWQVAASLPQQLQICLGGSVSIEMDTDKPYLYNDQHKKQYPPRQMEKVGTQKGKKKAKK